MQKFFAVWKLISIRLTYKSKYPGENNAMNQSELEAKTCNPRQAREKLTRVRQVKIGLAHDWLKKQHVCCAWFKPQMEKKSKQIINI